MEFNELMKPKKALEYLWNNKKKGVNILIGIAFLSLYFAKERATQDKEMDQKRHELDKKEYAINVKDSINHLWQEKELEWEQEKAKYEVLLESERSKNYAVLRRQKEMEELDKLAVKIMEADKLENLVNFSTMDNESYRKNQEVRVDKRHYINLLEVKAANLDQAEVWKLFIEKMRSPKLTRDRFYGSTTGI